MNFFLAREKEAQILLNDPEFTKKWQSLYEQCAWATVFQSPQYLSIWYDNYRDTVEFIILYEMDESGALIGLMPISFDRGNNKLSIAGDFHSEYQTWLALEENANSFIEKALDLLKGKFPKHRLQFLFLAANSPLEWLKGKWGKQVNLREMPRPLIEIGDGSNAEESLRKRGNKTRIRQLKRYGELAFTEIESAEEFEHIFDEIEDNSKIRLSALHNVLPKADQRRKEFHVDLMRRSDIVYGTLLKAGDKIVSAQICFKNRDEMLLCITSMSPFFANQSPSKIHILMLEQEFAKRGIPIFDLSPGEGYKDRFASHYDKAYALTVFFDKSDFSRYEARRALVKVSRDRLENLNIRKTRAFAVADKVRHKLSRVKFWSLPVSVAKNIGRKIYEKKECRFYSIGLEEIKNIPDYDFVRRNAIEDLLKYEPIEGWQFTRREFHSVCLDRFREGAISYSYAEGDKLLHYGWMLENQEVSYIPEVGDAEFHFPPNTAVLFDFYTHPDARGKGYYQRALSQMLHIAAGIPNVKQVFIGVMADNLSSRHVIEKVGFKYQSSLFMETKFGKKKIW